MRNIKKTFVLVLAVFASCSVCNADAISRSYEVSSGYVLERNGSWGYTEQYYYLSGNLHFTYDVPSYAAFDWVDVELDEEITYCEQGFQTTTSLNNLFHMTELQLTDANEAEINFVYEKNNPTFPFADVNVTVTFVGDNLLLTGRFSDDCYDGSQYDLYAIATQMRYSGGTGTPNNPYLIATPNDLNSIGQHPEDFNKCFLMTADINMAGYTYATALIAPDTNSIEFGYQGTPFTGSFDGDGFVIKHFDINSLGTYNSYLGLFGFMESGAQIKNVSLESGYVSGYGYLGGLIGLSEGGNISHCCFSGSVTGTSNDIGGLIGFSRDTTISHCHTSAQVTGTTTYMVGGLIGYCDTGTIIDCYATGSVTCPYDYVGGLVGTMNYDPEEDGTISNCYATGDVSGREKVGGLVGTMGGYVNNSFATGSVTGTYEVGGLVGIAYSRDYKNCYATGSVNGVEKVGGLVGSSSFGNLYSCYAAGSVSGDALVGGLMGDRGACFIYDSYFLSAADGGGPDNGLGEPLSKEQMEQQESFTGWDFINVWDIGENQTYPFLRKYLPSDINKDDQTNLYDLAILAEHWLKEF